MIHVHDEIANLQIPEIREERAREVPPLFGGAALFVEDIGLGVDLEPGVGQPEAPGEPPERHEYGGSVGVFDQIDGDRHELVLAQDLDHPLRPPSGFGHEHHTFAALSGLTDVEYPLRDAAVEGHRGLALDVTHRQRRPPLGRLGLLEHQLFESRRASEPIGHVFPSRVPRLDRRHWTAVTSNGLFETGLELLALLDGRCFDLLVLRHEDSSWPHFSKKLQDRDGRRGGVARRLLQIVLVEPLPHGNDQHVVG